MGLLITLKNIVIYYVPSKQNKIPERLSRSACFLEKVCYILKDLMPKHKWNRTAFVKDS